MTTRKLLSVAFAAALLSAPFAVTADAATAVRHTARHVMKPAKHHARMVSARSGRATSRDAGSSAVDSLNEQSLARARGGAAQ